ncbi:uncharacterized protein ColSpa_05851 [Colletotrichum spaethianum]|uniref:Uncharacterized protein n=1 Tax=Colletotrichum spaethianum TaxID=700344 RepID=A0AA37LGR8_9PEZI|nr:uncharacterized protein ColSpa_05851 [Colletotrichum spaethianum]GKT45670.1 hypothetical protein ColSpa_05851 [Colletotrichum spaethianum]
MARSYTSVGPSLITSIAVEMSIPNSIGHRRVLLEEPAKSLLDHNCAEIAVDSSTFPIFS